MPPMRVDFEIPYFTVSGIQVLQLDQIRSQHISSSHTSLIRC